MKTLPVTILSGFVGAGKTAVLQHVLKNLQGLKAALISNETQGEDLLTEVTTLFGTGQFDYLLIESTGVSEPMPLADFFSSLNADSEEACDIASIDTMVTVVDAANFLNDFQSVEELRDRGIGTDDTDNRDVARVLIEQIEFANVILLNKTDLVSEEECGLFLAVLRKLNPDARVLAIEHGQVPVEEVVNTGRHQLEWAAGEDAWQAMLAGNPTDETDAYGVTSFVYRARRPFHPQRFWDFWMEGAHAPSILRSKGYFWLATRNAVSGFWSHVGQVLAAEPGGAWWAETPRAEWPTDDPELLAELNSVWDEVWGDRRQELLLIGQDLDTAAARESLNACLLTDSEMQSGPSSWAHLHDPFGSWEQEHTCDGSHDHGHDHG
jgi:G3E family GTPase